jgi:hypothetical protein
VADSAWRDHCGGLYDARLMATDKRSRQRENRAVKKAEEAKAARRQLALKRIRRFVFYGLLIALVIFLATQVWGGGGDEASLGAGLGL